jgi:hypothetical protein
MGHEPARPYLTHLTHLTYLTHLTCLTHLTYLPDPLDCLAYLTCLAYHLKTGGLYASCHPVVSGFSRSRVRLQAVRDDSPLEGGHDR